jgi:glycine/D-amino acid oxidase-like deaminating enzyme/nitrite reductase/ring-hydroxylating ferredoxin subunit
VRRAATGILPTYLKGNLTMNSTSRHMSPWVDTMDSPGTYGTLADCRGVDVLVVGAGIVGLTSGLLLQRAGRKVAVLEARDLAASVTTHSTVKVTVGHGATYTQIAKKRGRTAAAHYAQANLDGMATLTALVGELGFDCDLRAGQRHLIYAEDSSDASQVESELAIARALGLPVTPVEDPGLPFPVAAAIAFEDQATFHPGKYVQGLLTGFVEAGGVLVTGVRATGADEDRDSCTVSTTEGDVSTAQVVVATGYPMLDRGGHFARLTATRSYGVAGVLPGASDPGMTISVGSPTHSTRTVELNGERLLIVVGEGHEVGHVTNTDERWDRLRDWAGAQFGVEDFRYHWSAEETRSDDHVPFAGLVNPGSRRIFTATGFAGWGMTNGTASAMLIADFITEQEPPAWAATFDARRAGTRLPGAQFVKQNLHVAKTWIKDRVGPARPAEELTQLTPGEGSVFHIDGSDTAVCRDDDGQLHAVSAVCTHLGCNVAWNRGEKSWDCPCHGSRFSMDGEVLHGPASSPLEKRSVDAAEHSSTD